MARGEKILVIGRHAEMLTNITAMLRQHGYYAIGKQSNEEAIETFHSSIIDAVIIGGGIDAESRKLFHTEFPKLQPKVKVIDAHPHTILSDLQMAFPDERIAGF